RWRLTMPADLRDGSSAMGSRSDNHRRFQNHPAPSWRHAALVWERCHDPEALELAGAGRREFRLLARTAGIRSCLGLRAPGRVSTNKNLPDSVERGFGQQFRWRSVKPLDPCLTAMRHAPASGAPSRHAPPYQARHGCTADPQLVELPTL